MKLNKKGFGVAEIAIVILLIGILAAAVIVGFMGIKNKANSHAAEEVSRSKDVINQTKHAYPIVISDTQKGIYIGADDYEVYDLNGYTVNAHTGTNYEMTYMGSINNTVAIANYGGTITVNGNGGAIITKATPIMHDLGTNGTTILNDLSIDNRKHLEGKNANHKYYVTRILGGTLVLNNVKINGCGGVEAYFGSKVYYNADDYGFFVNVQTNGLNGRYNFYLSDDVYAEIDGGTHSIRYNQGYIFAGWGTEVLVKDGIFKHNVSADAPRNLPYACFTIKNNDNGYKNYGESKVTIEGGLFMGHKNVGYVSFEYNGSKKADAKFVVLEIKGGEFITNVKNFSKGTGTIIITGGAFAFNPEDKNLIDTNLYKAVKDDNYKCLDGETRTMWVVTKK